MPDADEKGCAVTCDRSAGSEPGTVNTTFGASLSGNVTDCCDTDNCNLGGNLLRKSTSDAAKYDVGVAKVLVLSFVGLMMMMGGARCDDLV